MALTKCKDCGSVVAAITVLWLAGCAHQPQPTWHKPSAKSGEEMIKDDNECSYDAAKATINDTSPLRRNYNASELRAQCLRARGWVLR